MFWYIVGSYKMIKLVLYSPIYIYVCINIYTFIHISVHKHLCTYTYIHICMNVQVYIIWYACVWNNILSFTFIISLSFSSEFWATLLAFHTINLMSCKSILHVTATNENLNATSFFLFLSSYYISCPDYISGCSLLTVFCFYFIDTMSSSFLLRRLNNDYIFPGGPSSK